MIDALFLTEVSFVLSLVLRSDQGRRRPGGQGGYFPGFVSGSFYFSFFGQSDQKTKKSVVLFVYFLYKKSTFCLKMTAIFFSFFGQSDQK